MNEEEYQNEEEENPQDYEEYDQPKEGYQQPQQSQQPPQQQQPQQPPQQTQQQYAPYQHPQQYQQRSLTETLSSDSMLMWGVLIGVILLVIGVILNGSMFFVDSNNTVQSLMGLSLIFLQLGGVLFVLFLSMAAIFKEELSKYIKFGLLIIVALVMYALMNFMGSWSYLYSGIT